MKQVVVIVCAAVLSVVLIPLSVIVISDLMAARRSGANFGRHRTQAACVREVTRGRHVCTGTDCFLTNRLYFSACMDAARRSAELCATLPEFGSLLQLEMWKRSQCRELDRTDRTCHHIWLRALEACDTD